MEIILVVVSLVAAWGHGFYKGRKSKAEQIKGDIGKW